MRSTFCHSHTVKRRMKVHARCWAAALTECRILNYFKQYIIFTAKLSVSLTTALCLFRSHQSQDPGPAEMIDIPRRPRFHIQYQTKQGKRPVARSMSVLGEFEKNVTKINTKVVCCESCEVREAYHYSCCAAVSSENTTRKILNEWKGGVSVTGRKIDRVEISWRYLNDGI